MLPKDREPEIEPDPVIEVYKRDFDRTLHIATLKMTVEERLRHLMAMHDASDEFARVRSRNR